MLNKNVVIYYFSGTGNTKKLVDKFCEVLIKKDHKLDVFAIEKVGKISIREKTTIGLMFPVAIQSTYPLVWEFISKLPDVDSVDIFMFDTMEAFSGGIVGPLKKILTKKGYNCIGAREFKMSSSINTKLSKVEAGKRKNIQALKEVERYAIDLINGKTKWNRIPLLSDVMRSISSSRTAWTSVSERLSINEECIKCQICLKNCPTNAMSLINDKIVINNSKCNACMRCVSKCPQEAILIKGKKAYLS